MLSFAYLLRYQSPIEDEPELSDDEKETHKYVWNESTGAWDKVAR